MFKISSDSGKAIPPEIDLFSVPLTNIGIESSRVVEVTTSNSVQTVPWEFRINNSKNFIDLQRSRLLVRCSIRDANGARIQLQNAPLYGPINLIGQTMFRQLQVFIGGIQVQDSGVLYPYRAYMQSICSNTLDYKKTHLGLAGYTHEEGPGDPNDDGFDLRCEWAANGATMEFIAPLSADLFQQPRAILPYLDLRIVLHPAADSFRIQQRNGVVQNYTMVVEDIVFLSRQITCHDASMLAIDSMLRERRAITYPLNSIQMRSFFISAGRITAPEHKLFTAATPRRLICGLVAAENFNGNYNTNPFNFRNFNISEIFLDMGSETLPLRSYNMDFPNNRCARPFLALQETLGFTRSGESNGITYENFRNGYTLFGFEISPNAQDTESRDLLKMGETSLRITFSQPTPPGGIYAVILAEFSSELSINSERIPTVDSIL